MASNGITTKLIDWLITPENIDKAGDWAKKNVKLIEKLTQNKMLPSSIRLYLRSISGSDKKINEDFFSKNELAEIKKRVTEAEVSKAVTGFATSGAASVFRAVAGHSGIGYEASKPKTLKNALMDDAVNIDMTLGQAGFYRNKDGTYQVYDKHNFSNMMGSLYWYGDDKQIAKQIEALTPLYEDSDVVAGKILESTKFDTVEPNKEVLTKVIEAYKNGDISFTKLARTIGGYLAHHNVKDITNEEGVLIDFDRSKETGVPMSINIGTISQKDKYQVDQKMGFGEYDENWDAKTKGEYDKAPTLGEAYAQMIFDDSPRFSLSALGHPSGKSPSLPGEGMDKIMGEYEDVGIPSAIRMEAQKYIKKREIDELDPNWQEARRHEGYYWDKDLDSKLAYGPQFRSIYDTPSHKWDLKKEGIPYFPFWDETEAAMAYQEKGKPHHPTYQTVPYYIAESGEDLYPGYTEREYEYKDGGLIGAGLTLLESRDNPHAGVETLFERK